MRSPCTIDVASPTMNPFSLPSMIPIFMPTSSPSTNPSDEPTLKPTGKGLPPGLPSCTLGSPVQLLSYLNTINLPLSDSGSSLSSFNGQCDVNTYPWGVYGPTTNVSDWTWNDIAILSSPPIDWFSIPAMTNHTAQGYFVSEPGKKCPLLARTTDYMPLQWIKNCRVPKRATYSSILSAYATANVMNPSGMYNCPAGNNPFRFSSTDGSLFIPTPNLVGHGANSHWECSYSSQAYLPGELFPIPAVHPYDLKYTCPIGTDSVISVCIGGTPTYLPTGVPTSIPTGIPTSVPTGIPLSVPTGVPTSVPTGIPILTPTIESTSMPSTAPHGNSNSSSCCENEDFQTITKTESNVTINSVTTTTVSVTYKN
jgi:hypothetical protein